MLVNFDHLMIVEFIPFLVNVVLGDCSVMASIQCSSVENHCEKIIYLVYFFLRVELRYHEVFHVKALNRVVNRCILLLVCHVPFESLQCYNKDRRGFIDLNFLDCLLVLLALVTVPFILPTQLLRHVELPEAI